MNWSQQCIVVLPCFNEERGLAALLPGLRRILPNVLVMDDGSTDATAALAGRHGAQVCRLEQNHGKGTVVRLGLDRARRQGYPWVLLMDGDGQHSPQDIPAFLMMAETSRVDMVVGNRMERCAEMPLIRRWTNRYLSRRISALLDQDFPDTQCGFRLVRLDALQGLNLATTGFEIESEMLAQMAVAGRRIAFVPIATIYQHEHSKIHPLRDSLRWFRWLHDVKKQMTSVNEPSGARFKPSQA